MAPVRSSTVEEVMHTAYSPGPFTFTHTGYSSSTVDYHELEHISLNQCVY